MGPAIADAGAVTQVSLSGDVEIGDEPELDDASLGISWPMPSGS